MVNHRLSKRKKGMEVKRKGIETMSVVQMTNMILDGFK